ncbi:hypothetical protein KAR10_03030, partial [bacterium]|nr:hypothetical protein [bacterium]
LSYLLCFLLAIPVNMLPLSGYGRIIDQPPVSQSEYPFRQLVIYIPDIFDNAKEIDKALSRLRAKGILSQDIINLAQHPDFDLKSGLAAQAEQLAKIAEVESAKRKGLKAHLIAKGSGGLVARSYLAEAREIRPAGAPIIDVIGIGVPHNGRLWAKWAYFLSLPLPKAGMRATAVRDLSPDSRFMRKLNFLKRKREKLVHEAEKILKNIDDSIFNHKLKTKLAAIDRAKSAAVEQAGRLFNAPESIHLSPQDRQRIHDMKNSYQALKMLCEKYEDIPAKKPGVNTLVRLGDGLNREHAKILRKIAAQTQKPADWLKRSPLAQKLLKIKDLTGVIEAGNDQAQNRLLALFRSPKLYPLDMVSENPKNQVLAALAAKIRVREELFPRHKCKKALDELDHFYSHTAPELKKHWDSFTAKPVTVSWEHMAHKPGNDFSGAIRKLRKLQQQYLALAHLQTAWDAMEESRQKWLAGLRQYAEAEANMLLRDGFQTYQENLERQARQLKENAPLDFVKIRRKLDQAKQNLSPALDQLFYSPDMSTLTDTVRTGYRTFKIRQRNFWEAVDYTRENVSSRIVKKEYLLYLERANQLDQLVMDKIFHGPKEARQAILALEKGSAVKEMKMFAQASRRRLDREFGKLDQRIDVHPSFETRFSPELARILNESLNIIKQGAGNYKSLRDLDYLKRKSDLLKSHLQKQAQEAKRSLAACAVIRALEQTGHAGHYMKMIRARSTEELNRELSWTDFAAELSHLAQERRNLVRAVLNITGQS